MLLIEQLVDPKSERIIQVREALGLKPKPFADALGEHVANYYAIEKGGRSIGKHKSNDLIAKINNLPADILQGRQLNSEWWEKGEGEMFLQISNDSSRSHKKNRFNDAIPLKMTPKGEVQKNWAGSEFQDLPEEMILMTVPLVDEFAYAGYLSGYKDAEYLKDLPKHSIVVPKRHAGKYRAFVVRGDSMDSDRRDAICAGDIVTGRNVDKSLWNAKFHLHRFENYVIVHQDGILTKRIAMHNVEEGIITCVSINPDKQAYPDFDIRLAEVYEIYNIVEVSRKMGRS